MKVQTHRQTIYNATHIVTDYSRKQYNRRELRFAASVSSVYTVPFILFCPCQVSTVKVLDFILVGKFLFGWSKLLTESHQTQQVIRGVSYR